ncbi:hypothetical protein NQ315_001502 [Exocentrus adspersus]|uniref:Peptidase S1 domain-containing protein n=1 Tax=Exocentrus adspersus TaxID=1586481 RepID=A0AAV8W9R7_9CUCU|nr:hypothetical protein NQ315_001502 [Exocentrus adspersus]
MKAVLVCFSVLFTGIFAAAPSLDPPTGRIVGGTDAARGQLPYQVSIQYCLNSNNCQHSCGGAIIGSLWILSAAHCITQAPALGSYKILAGILNLNDTNLERQEIRVSYVLIHPDYQGGINPHDLAIYRLTQPLSFSNQVEPINLPEADEIYEGVGRVSGWGSLVGTETPVMPTTLQYIDTPVISTETCKTALDSLLGGQPHPLDLASNLCTGPLTGGISTCNGDSGGPVADAQGQKLVGITSWWVTPCGTVGAPSIHIKIAHYVRWIQSSINV